MESQNILSWKGSMRIIQTQHDVPEVTGKLQLGVSCMCKTTSVFRNAQQCRGRKGSWNSSEQTEASLGEAVVAVLCFGHFSLLLGQEQRWMWGTAWLCPKLDGALSPCSVDVLLCPALGQLSCRLVWKHAVIIPSVQRTCLPVSGVPFAAGGGLGECWDEAGGIV